MVLGTIRSNTALSSEFSLHANGPRDNSVEHCILIRILLTRKWSQGQFGRVLHSHPSSPYTQMVPGTIRSSPAFSSEFSLHANGPRDNSVEHCILIRVLLTRKWSQGQFGRALHSHPSSPYTQMAPGTIQSSTSFSSEFSLHANGPRDNSVESLHSIWVILTQGEEIVRRVERKQSQALQYVIPNQINSRSREQPPLDLACLYRVIRVSHNWYKVMSYWTRWSRLPNLLPHL
jgi:hypothetical protein